MHPYKFTRLYWASLLASLACALIAAIPFAAHIAKSAPRVPELPAPGQRYIGSYGRGPVDHYLFRFGIFGFGERLRQSDVLLVGTSHVELGLSARELAAHLLDDRRERVRVFNIAMELGEGISFARDIVERNDLRDKLLIADMYNQRGAAVSSYAAAVRSADVVVAYFSVATIWLDFLKDWTIDGFLPRLAFYDDASSFDFKVGRYLQRAIVRDWNTGDLLVLWSPVDGNVHQNPPARLVRTLAQGPIAPANHDFAPVFSAVFPPNLLQARRIRPLLSLLPFQGAPLEWARREARRLDYPLIEISPDNIQYIDTDHMTAGGRSIATERLARRLLALLPR